MENILKQFVNIEKNIRRNNMAIIGLVVVMITMVITFGVTTFKTNTYFAAHRLVLEGDGLVRRASMMAEKDALIIEIKDFMNSFYHTFYTFDEYTIDSCLNLGFYKGDESLRTLYIQYKNEGWYNTILQENLSQSAHLNPDGFKIDVSAYPYKLSVTGVMILRRNKEVKRFALNGSCYLEQVTRNFPKNPHGFYIRNWKEERYPF
jgi:hypothetical protein